MRSQHDLWSHVVCNGRTYWSRTPVEHESACRKELFIANTAAQLSCPSPSILLKHLTCTTEWPECQFRRHYFHQLSLFFPFHALFIYYFLLLQLHFSMKEMLVEYSSIKVIIVKVNYPKVKPLKRRTFIWTNLHQRAIHWSRENVISTIVSIKEKKWRWLFQWNHKWRIMRILLVIKASYYLWHFR